MSFWAVEGNEGGFLPAEKASCDEALPYGLYEHVRVEKELLELARAGELRTSIAALPFIEVCLSEGEYQSHKHNKHQAVRLYTAPEQEAAFSLFGILAGGYVHALSATGREEEDTKTIEIPACVAVPFRRLSMSVGRLPIWDYAGCVLSNWKIKDSTRSVSLENIEILRTFTNLEAEKWFYKIHVVIEAYGGQAMAAVFKARAAAKLANSQKMKHLYLVQDLVPLASEVNECLKRLSACVQMMKLTFSRMPEKCKAEDFYNIVRPWLAGWPSRGVVYGVPDDDNAEVDNKAKAITQVLGGGSGAQSSLMPCLDAFLGVKYAPDDGSAACPGMKKFIEQLQKYRLHMPIEHCHLIQTLEKENVGIRSFLSHCNNVVGIWYPSKKDKEMEEPHNNDNEYKGDIDNTQDGNGSSEFFMDSIPMVHREQQRMEALKLSIELYELKKNYNQVVETMLSFRRMHVGFATLYISRQAKDLARTASEIDGAKILENAAVGTGGSTFAKHLMHHIDDTRQCLYKIRSPPIPEIDIEERLQLDREPEKSWYSYGMYEALQDHIDKLSSLFGIINDDANDSDVDLMF
mmetsp:Transcript_25261/g.30834  ORF Transcript_25261/g.30834 Transcript_25261/m.30834 type:complete len:576 (+) Transcript_25261:152-1879(+)